MAAAQLTGSLISARNLPSFNGLRPSAVKFSPSVAHVRVGGLANRSFTGLVVRAATVVAPKYTSIKPLGDRVLVKLKEAEEKTDGGILLPTTAQSKPQGGEVVAVGEGKTIGNTKVEASVKTGAQVVYSKYAGTELEFNGSKHLILKEDDIVGILETDDAKDLQPLNDRVLIKVAEAEEKTAGGLLLTEATQTQKTKMFLKYFLLLLLAVVLLTTTQALKHPSDSNQEVIPLTDERLPTTTTTNTDPDEESKFYKKPYYKRPYYKRPPYKKYPPYKKHPPYKKYPPSSD